MSGRLRLNFYDASFERISDEIEVRLEHTILHHVLKTKSEVKNGKLQIEQVDTGQGGRYVLWVNPTRYRSVFRIIRVKDDPEKNDEHIILPIDPRRVIDVRFPEFNLLSQDFVALLAKSKVEGFPNAQGQALYDALQSDLIKKAGLFNLHSKTNTTFFHNGRPVFSYMDSLSRIRGDRIFAEVQKELRDEVKNACLSNMFKEVSGTLHTPPPGYKHAGSFKSFENYGNLQLTFFSNPGTLEFIVDADIDDAGGLKHVFQVLEHTLTGTETHPFDIHQILSYQHINPGYQLVV